MSKWGENKVLGLAAGVIFVIVFVFMFIQINQNIQQKKKQMEEFERWKNTPQAGKASR